MHVSLGTDSVISHSSKVWLRRCSWGMIGPWALRLTDGGIGASSVWSKLKNVCSSSSCNEPWGCTPPMLTDD